MDELLEEALYVVIEAMEEEGVDFKEEVGMTNISLPDRPDLHIEICICDKDVMEIFNGFKQGVYQ